MKKLIAICLGMAIVGALALSPLAAPAASSGDLSLVLTQSGDQLFVILVNQGKTQMLLNGLPADVNLSGNGIQFYFASMRDGKLVGGPAVSSGSTALGVAAPPLINLEPHAIVGRSYKKSNIAKLYQLRGCYMASVSFRDNQAKPFIRLAARQAIRICIE